MLALLFVPRDVELPSQAAGRVPFQFGVLVLALLTDSGLAAPAEHDRPLEAGNENQDDNQVRAVSGLNSRPAKFPGGLI
eukprot:scaffold32741_cov16-Tisochrysis_lutea.AAC.3